MAFSLSDGAKCADAVTKDSLAEFNVGNDLWFLFGSFLTSRYSWIRVALTIMILATSKDFQLVKR